MPLDENDASAGSPPESKSPGASRGSGNGRSRSTPSREGPGAPRRRRRIFSRRNAIISGGVIGGGIVALLLLSFFAVRLGYVDEYVAGQIKTTLASYGIRAEIKEFHTAFTPQTVEILGVQLYDARSGEQLGKIDRILATVRIEDLYAMNLQRNINLKDLQIEGLELWVKFDAQGQSNFSNLIIPPPEPNRRILFAYSTAHVAVKNSVIHYGDARHSLSGEARNVHATIDPKDPNQPPAEQSHPFLIGATNSTFTYDGRDINNIDIDVRGRANGALVQFDQFTLRSPVAEVQLQGAMDDWRALRYHFNVTSTVDLTQISDVAQAGVTLRGAGNFTGKVTGEGDRYQVEGGIKSDALAADGVRLQALNLNAKGSGQGNSYNFNGRAVAELLTAGNFQLNAVQLSGGVMGTGSDFRWIGELRAAAEKGYGTTITGLILRDARAEYRDGILTASAPQLSGNTLSSSGAKVEQGVQANDLRLKVENGTTTATVASAKAGKIVAGKASVAGVTAKSIEIKNRDEVTNVTISQVQVGEANAFGAKTGSINIAGVRLAIHNGRIQGSSSDINAGTVALEDGQVEDVKLTRPVFIVEPSGRYRASADLSLGGGVLGRMKLGPAHAAVVASGDQIQLNNFEAAALDGKAAGNATIALTKKGASRVNLTFDNFDLPGAITVFSGRAVPIASKATGNADLTFTGTDVSTASGKVNAQFKADAAPAANLARLSGELALTANQGVFQLQRASLSTDASRLNASGQFSLENDSNLHVDLSSTDAAELQRILISSGAIPQLESQFDTYGLGLGGKLVFNGTLTGALRDPLVSGHAELGSLLVNNRDLGSVTATITTNPNEMRVTDGRLIQPNGGGAQFALLVPRTGENNISIDATLDRLSGQIVPALQANLQSGLIPHEFSMDSDISGQIKVTGIPEKMSGVADLRFGPGSINGEPLQSMTARATFNGSNVNVEKVEANLNAGHIVANGTYDTTTKTFDITATGDQVQLARLQTYLKRPDLPKLTGTAVAKLTARGTGADASTYQINFDADSSDVAIDGRSAGALKLTGRTENKQLNISFSTTGLLGEQPQLITARVDLSNEKLPTMVESTVAGADLTQVLKILLPNTVVAVTGRTSGTVKLSGNLITENAEGEEELSFRGLTGTATFTELSVRVEDNQLTATGPLVLQVAPNEVIVQETTFTGQDTNVTVRGAVATAAGGRNTLAVNGQINLRILSGLSPDIFSSGVGVLAINLGGTYDNPRVTGRASVDGASVSVLLGDQRLTLANLEGVIFFNASQAQIERLKGTLGGGKIEATGGAQLSGFSISQFLFNIHGDNVTLNYPQDFRSTVDLDLELRGNEKIQFIRGDVMVRRTEYTKDILLEQLLNQRPQTSIEEGGEFKFSETAVLDKLRIEGRNALVMRNNLGNIVASLSLRLSGPVKDPLIEGRITATNGTLNFRNKPYELTRGLIYLPARYGADPILNIEGQSMISGYRVRAAIDGPLSHPNTIVSSEPALPQADVVSLILTGSLSSNDASTSVLAQSGVGTAASLLTDALINTPVSRATNKLFGLSRFEISPVTTGTNATPTARLTVARRLSKDVTVTYSTNLASDANQVLAVEYRVSDRISFLAEYVQGSTQNLSTQRNNYSFEIRFRRRF